MCLPFCLRILFVLSCLSYLVVSFSVPFTIRVFALLFSLLPIDSRNKEIRGRKACSPPSPPPQQFLPFIFYREETSVLSSVVESHRIAPTHATIKRRFQHFTMVQYRIPNKKTSNKKRQALIYRELLIKNAGVVVLKSVYCRTHPLSSNNSAWASFPVSYYCGCPVYSSGCPELKAPKIKSFWS